MAINRTARLCSLAGCRGKHHARGLCGPHYHRQRRLLRDEVAYNHKSLEAAGLPASWAQCTMQGVAVHMTIDRRQAQLQKRRRNESFRAHDSACVI